MAHYVAASERAPPFSVELSLFLLRVSAKEIFQEIFDRTKTPQPGRDYNSQIIMLSKIASNMYL